MKVEDINMLPWHQYFGKCVGELPLNVFKKRIVIVFKQDCPDYVNLLHYVNIVSHKQIEVLMKQDGYRRY